MFHRAASRICVVLAISISAGFCQSAAPKPLRERLLEQAQKGDAEAQFDLGKNYETGRIGLSKDIAKALEWYRAAASHGEPFAEASLGLLYEFGKGVQQDFFEAYKLYDRSVSHLTSGDRETVLEMRERIADKLTPAQISQAQRLTKEWKPAPITDAQK